MRPKALVFTVVALFWTTLVLADKPTTPPSNASAASPEGYSVEATLEALTSNHELWLEAELAGHSQEADRIEKRLISMLNQDIFFHQRRVSEMAKAMVMSSVPGSGGPNDPGPADTLSRKAAFNTSINYLNAKENLRRSIEKTDAFSNKYRLLGDYIDLLRRELDMPRLKLASSKASDDGEDAKKTAPEQE